MNSRRVAILLAFLPCALAQFRNIAVTDDAGQIYFVSSVPLRGESNPGGGIYRWSGERWEQFVPPVVNSPTPGSFLFSDNDRPVVSGGGTVVAWRVARGCIGGSRCIPYPTTWTSVIMTADGQRTSVPGRVHISRNGRYIIQEQEVYNFSFPHAVTRIFRDLQTGTTIDLDFPPQGVVSDGRVLGSDAQGLFLWSRSGGRQHIAGTAGLATPLISDDGTRVIAARGEPTEIVSLAVDTGLRTSLGRGIAAGISNDGLRALVLSAPGPAEAFVADTVSGTRTQLVPGIRVNSAALAGFGRFAVLATTDGRMLKVTIDSGHVEELIPRTPSLSSPFGMVPCSALRLEGQNLANALEAASVTLDGEAIPVIAASPDTVWVQVPCELEPSPASRSLDLRSASPFGAPVAVQLQRSRPRVVRIGDWDTVHEDFSGAVTRDRPARPGEIVHLWGTGFGPVDRVMRTGEPGPASPPARLLNPITCQDNRSGGPVEVLFGGLAPGLVGFNQLDVRVPLDAREFLGVNCTLPDNASLSFLVDVRP